MPIETRNQLTRSKVKSIMTPGRYGDGQGLYLVVREGGSRYWQWRGTVLGKRREIGIGSAHRIALADARVIAAEWLEIARSGGNPAIVRDQDKRQSMTFADAATVVWEKNIRPEAKNPKHARQWFKTLEDYAFPIIGSRDVRGILQSDVLKVLEPIWLEKPETGRRVRQRMSVVFDWARTANFAEGVNPVVGVEHGLPKQGDKGRPKHYAALPYRELPDLMQQIRMVDGVGALALRFAILTAGRGGEVRNARWDEFDLEAGVWTVPADRMKSKRDHRVPLSDPALEVVREVKQIDPDLVFSSTKRGRPISDMTMSAVLRRLDVPVTVHGFRSTFRDWAEEMTGFEHRVKEAALAHTVRSRVEASYNRTDLLEKRRDLMGAWGRFAANEAAQEAD
jgi:integrase